MTSNGTGRARTRLGVDLGTTWTAAALLEAGAVESLALGTGIPVMPSVLAVDGGEVVAGERAERRILVDPASGLRECKRRLGDTTPLVMAGQPYGAETLLGHLLRHVVEAARDELGDQPDEIVVTHPAVWGDYKLDLLREAARQAGAGPVTLVPEPVAAALHYVGLGRIGPGDVVAVYDFGGGTFDAAVVQCTERGAELLGPPEGLERVGGVDLDQLVVQHVDHALDGRLRGLDTTGIEGRRALTRLRVECTAAKEALSADTEVTIAVALPGLHTEVHITRDEFEAAARSRIADTLGALDRAIANAAVRPAALTGVLLVGGSSRLPVVADEVSRRTGRPTLLDADPKLVVALGAAGGSTAMSPSKKADPTDPAEDARPTSPPPPPPSPPSPGPESASAQAAGRAAALRAAANMPPANGGKGGKGRKGVTTAVGVGAAVAGTAAAGYAAYELLDDDGGEDEAAAETPEDLLEAADDGSLDAFDDPGGGGGGGGGSLRSGGERVIVTERPAPAAKAPGPIADPELADISDARAELLERFAAWQPPADADPAEVAAFRAEIQGLIDRFEPRPGQSANDALAELRRQFDDQVEDFVQDLKLDAVEDRDGTPPSTPTGPHWEWDAADQRWEWDAGTGSGWTAEATPPPQPGFEWLPTHVEDHQRPDGVWVRETVPGQWARESARNPVRERPGLEWVDNEVDASGRPVPPHWEAVPPNPPPGPAAPPPINVPLPETAPVRQWVEGRYDQHGRYVKGHWEESSVEHPTPRPVDENAPPPPIIENPPEPPPPPPPPPPTDPYEPPVVRDHRGDDGPSWSPDVRDHRGDNGGVSVTPSGPPRARDRQADAEDTSPWGPFGPPTGPAPGGPLQGIPVQQRRLQDVFEDVATPRQQPSTTMPDDDQAPPEAEAVEPAAPDGSTTTADDLLGVDAFADASAAAPDLQLAAEIPPPAEPAAPEAAPAPLPEPEIEPPMPAPAPEPDMSVVDPVPADGPSDIAPADDFAEPPPAAGDDETPQDLDNDPHTPQ